MEEPILTIQTEFEQREREKDYADAEIDRRRCLRYCTVGLAQYLKIQEQTEGTKIYIWMGEERRAAWKASSFK